MFDMIIQQQNVNDRGEKSPTVKKKKKTEGGGATEVLDRVQGQTRNRTLALGSCMLHLFP